jgi:hypothetical protein
MARLMLDIEAVLHALGSSVTFSDDLTVQSDPAVK